MGSKDRLDLCCHTFAPPESMSRVKDYLRKIVSKLPFALTKNLAYDRQTRQIMEMVLRRDSNCIDIGCHKGEVLEEILELAPEGKHFGFEPIPELFEFIGNKFDERCTFHQVALSDEEGTIEFNHVTSNPAFSGILQREYPKEEEIEKIQVRTARLDDLIGTDVLIDLIKIDVEGAELGVLKGGKQLIKRCRPVVVFEHGLGASDKYGTQPADVYELLSDCGLKLNTLKGWLKEQAPLSLQEFEHQYNARVNYYFIAYH